LGTEDSKESLSYFAARTLGNTAQLFIISWSRKKYHATSIIQYVGEKINQQEVLEDHVALFPKAVDVEEKKKQLY
jgi:hypothetical protein